jgi:hypothetical protein
MEEVRRQRNQGKFPITTPYSNLLKVLTSTDNIDLQLPNHVYSQDERIHRDLFGRQMAQGQPNGKLIYMASIKHQWNKRYDEELC